MKYIMGFFREIYYLLQAAIIYWPNTRLGTSMRNRYWRNRLDSPGIEYIGRGTSINSSDPLHIGSRFMMGPNVTIDNGDSCGCYIGDFVAIGGGSYFRTANHKSSDVSIVIMDQGHEAKAIEFMGKSYSIVVEDDVWISTNCIILSGAHIGEGSVIGAGSVVSSYIPPFSIVMGNPARLIANRKKIAQHVKSEVSNI